MGRVLEVVRSPRVMLAAVLCGVAWAASAQQPAAPGSQGPRPPTPVTTNFTGSVSSLDAGDIRAVRFQYAAGARSYWHSHAGAQILALEQGLGRAQVRGQKMIELRPGQPVQLPAGVPHWHGASPDQGLVQIAVNIGAATWLAPVTEDEYLGKQ